MCNDVQWLVMPSSFLQKLPWVLRRFWWMRPLCERSRLLWLRLLWRCENCNKGDDVFSIDFGLVICNRGHARTFFESIFHGRAQMLNLFLRRPCRCYPHRGSSCCWVSFLHLVRKWQCQLLRHFFMRSCHTCPILSGTFRCHQSITRMREPTYMTWLVFERVGRWHGYGILYRMCCDMSWRYSRSVAIGWFGVIFDDLWLTKRTAAGLQILQPHFSLHLPCVQASVITRRAVAVWAEPGIRGNRDEPRWKEGTWRDHRASWCASLFQELVFNDCNSCTNTANIYHVVLAWQSPVFAFWYVNFLVAASCQPN